MHGVAGGLFDDQTLKQAFIRLREEGMLGQLGMSDECLNQAKTLFHQEHNGEPFLYQREGMLWLQKQNVPEYLRSHYWRAFSRHSVVGVNFYEFIIAICAANPQTPHAGIWRTIRNNYIFSAFDINGKDTLDAVEFRVMISCMLRLSNQRCDPQEVSESTKRAAKKIGGNRRTTLSRSDWIQAEELGKFGGCENLFRITFSFQDIVPASSAVPEKEGNVIIHKNAVEFSNVINVNLHQSIAHSPTTQKKITTVSSRLQQKREKEDENSINLSALVKAFIKTVLVNPYECKYNQRFSLLTIEQLHQLCIGAKSLFASERNCVGVVAPVRVFGDIHGQMEELLVLLSTFGSPNHYTGDVELVSYVFNGDFVDRGPHSLEVISLLFCLKVAYPHRVFLVRGNHEDAAINSKHGFLTECETRLGDECGTTIWNLFNEVFSYMPIAALINEKILCVHGGIGGSLETLQQLDDIPKPITDIYSSEILRDVLWSDPAESDEILGVHANPRGRKIVSFGSDRVHSFCKNNNIEVIIRSHQCIEHGYEFFSGGHLITVFSAANYQNLKNDGALLEISISHQNKLVIRPKVYKIKRY